ncbi:unnamed protein product [Adineta steineri]|uniref:Uncharacterized protein n=1 Tax=Adineta steineri TaxID=433720 RepID=A0A818ULM6_9BILA|nr:unnamed protein product [Adineta steineri]
MAAKSSSRKSSVTRDNSNHSSLGGLIPISSPTPHSQDTQSNKQNDDIGVSNPNIYVVQPFKQRSKPKDLVYSKKNAPNPGENLLNSTIELINHFTVCYEAVKEQLQNEQIKQTDHQSTNNKSMVVGTRNKNNKTNNQQRPAKQARLRPLILHEDQYEQRNNQQLFIGDSSGMLSESETNDIDLSEIYNEKLRLLRKLKPEFFDYEGNLISRKGSTSQSLIESSLKKSTMSSFRISQNPHLKKENDQETFLTELLKRGENEEKCLSLVSTEQTSSINEMMKDNYILKVIDIKTKKSRPNSKCDSIKSLSLSDKENLFLKKENTNN